MNSKYLKTKQNRKLKVKFFRLFRVLHPVGKQAYKLELSKKWRIHDVFHVLPLEQDTTKKERVEKVPELNAYDNTEEYKLETIRDSAVYANESKLGHLPGLYYLITWKGYLKEENTWEPLLAVQHLKKLISSFHKNHPEKLTTTFLPIDSASPMVRSTIKLTQSITEQKQGQPAKSANKWAKKNWNSSRNKQLPFWLDRAFFLLQTLA